MRDLQTGRFCGECQPLAEHLLGATLASEKIEHGKMAMQLIRYRQVLVDNGIEPPDESGEDLLAMWRDAAMVITTASDFVSQLGTSAELLDSSWKMYGEEASKWKRLYRRPA